MMNEPIIGLGIMSGSSLDGIDLAWIRFPGKAKDRHSIKFEWVQTEFHPYSPLWKERLENASSLDAKELLSLHVDYSNLISKVIHDFEDPAHQSDFIAFHGHTVFHEPDKGYSCQLGRGDHLAQLTQRVVIDEFRNEDIAMQGQGAPLIPIVDHTFFRDHNYLINLGGICNLTINTSHPNAFDICGFNQVLNHLSRKKGWDYDKNGALSAQGKLEDHLLSCLNDWNYLQQPFPKSLSNQQVQNFYLPLLDQWEIAEEDKMKTFLYHVCDSIQPWIKSHDEKISILLSGGGALNDTFVKTLQKHTKHQVRVMDSIWVEYKEAFLMAFMGYLRWQKLPNVLSSVTGSLRDHSAGIMHFPK